MLEKTQIKDLKAGEITAFQAGRGNTHESNHRYGDRSFMEILLAGSEKLKRQFADSDLYKIDLGGSE